MLYTDKAAQRLLGNAAQAKVTEVMPDGAFVTWKADDGQCSGFIPKAKFVELFIGDRKARARGIQVTENAFYPGYYTAYNSYSESRYNLKASTDTIQCQCPDYQKQLERFGKGCCKHGYAVLNAQGFKSLADYIEAKRFDYQEQRWQEERDYIQASNY